MGGGRIPLVEPRRKMHARPLVVSGVHPAVRVRTDSSVSGGPPRGWHRPGRVSGAPSRRAGTWDQTARRAPELLRSGMLGAE